MKKRFVSLLLAGVLTVSAIAMTGCGDSKDEKGGSSETFSWWIISADGDGTYYDEYEDNPGTQWLNAQYWDTENGGLGDKSNGTNIQFTFQTPIAGSETDNFNTMIATGEYPDIVDMSYYNGSIQSMVEDGIAMDITEYVEKYMPDYVAYLEANPEVKARATITDDKGKVHYYYLPLINDGPREGWEGFVYRRDWIVKYATPSEYVWDWDSEYVKENGHPAVTPLSKAQDQGNLEGWKKNTVTSFKAEPGDDPDNTYQDNVIFPSGTENPLTISDWEWMLEAFDKAIADLGYEDDADAYGISVAYGGYFQMGDLVSSFGGGNGYYYTDSDHQVSFDATSDNFKTYIECLAAWDDKGWLDSRFETRASDLFYMINQSGFNQGKVGMWEGMVWDCGVKIRTTCMDEGGQKDAYVMGCSMPMNDVYGTEDQQFSEPDCFYNETGGVTTGGVMITDKAADKDLAALFTFFNWCYTEEGARTLGSGLSKEQYESVELDPDLYKEYGFTDGMYYTREEDGKTVYCSNIPQDTTINGNAFSNGRLTARLALQGTAEGSTYKIDSGECEIYKKCRAEYDRYSCKGNVTNNITDMLSDEENSEINKVNTVLLDALNQKVPSLIKNGLSGWNDYVKEIGTYDTDSVCRIYQKYVDEIYK